jgi:RNA polymerase sigma factor (sigma-70 family)
LSATKKLRRQKKTLEARAPTAKDNLGLARLASVRFAAKGEPVEDTEQYADACIGLVLAEKDFDPDKGLFSSWAFGKARKEVVNGYRERARHSIPAVDVDGIDVEFPAENEPLDVSLLDKFLAPHPHDSEHDRRNRQLMIDHFLHGESQTDIANRLGLTKMAVCLAIKSAITKIRERYLK